jgi:hypothetical protein
MKKSALYASNRPDDQEDKTIGFPPAAALFQTNSPGTFAPRLASKGSNRTRGGPFS